MRPFLMLAALLPTVAALIACSPAPTYEVGANAEPVDVDFAEGRQLVQIEVTIEALTNRNIRCDLMYLGMNIGWTGDEGEAVLELPTPGTPDAYDVVLEDGEDVQYVSLELDSESDSSCTASGKIWISSDADLVGQLTGRGRASSSRHFQDVRVHSKLVLVPDED